MIDFVYILLYIVIIFKNDHIYLNLIENRLFTPKHILKVS